MPFYLNPVRAGLDAVINMGDGYSIVMRWFQAFPTIKTNKIAYHLYFSTTKENVFSEGVKFISIDDALEANIIDLTPGQEYFFSVRPVEYNPALFDLTLLPIAHDNLRIYPFSLLREDISATDLIIPLLDLTNFTPTGVVKIGIELIAYSALDEINSNLILTTLDQRGVFKSTTSSHTVSGFDGYHTFDPTVFLFVEEESDLFDRIFACQCRFEYPNYPFTIIDGYHQVTKDLLSTDLSAADAANEGFPQYDYSGYHGTDPVLLLNGTCVGSYQGGEQGCIDGYGNINMVRGLNLQDQNTQRQDIELSVTGRVAVLIKRVQTGITCSCYLASSEYPDDRCPLCFAPGTLINTKEGFRPIEEIKIGDEVLSSDGEFHKVLNTFQHKYNGKLRSITTTTTTNSILCTPNHSFLSLGGSHHNPNGCGPNSNCKEFIKRGNGKRSNNGIKQLPSGNWHARAQAKNHPRKILGTFCTKEEAQEAIDNYLFEHNQLGHIITWKNSSQIIPNDWLVNKYYRYIKDISEIEIPIEYQKNTKLGSVRNGTTKFIVDEEFLWMIGLYLAEGSNSKRNIVFSLHKNEVEFQNRIIKYFNSKGYHSTIFKISENGVAINVYSTSLAQWLPKWLGHLCNNKKIPLELMYLPDEKSQFLLQGIFDGDGCKGREELIQTSEILALQVTEILHRLGKQPIIRRIQNNVLTPRGNKRKIAYSVSRERHTFTHKSRRGRWEFNENLLTRVRNIENIDYNGHVYNLEVEKTHNYIVQNIIVHNCNSTKFVIGYEQYFNPKRSDGRILVRPGPTDDTTKMYEAGLESEFPLSLWTLTVPTIKTRDIIVLFDQDNNEEFRYEVISVTRNNTILGQQGGQLFKVMRIRKFDPAYQIRIFRDTSKFPTKISTSIGFVLGIPPHLHTLVRSEKITSVDQMNQMTDVVQGHNHECVNGIITPVLGHTHKLLF